MKHEIEPFFRGAEFLYHFGQRRVIDNPKRIEDRHFGADSYYLNVVNLPQRGDDFPQAGGRQAEGVAAGEEYVIDFRMGFDISHRRAVVF